MTFKTLYKRDSKGKTRQYDVEVIGNKYRTIAGLVNGKKVTSEWSECFGKNIGKANETSDEEQAQFEAMSHWTKKKEKHYYENVQDIGKDKFFKAMLAHKYQDYELDFSEGLYSQPKLDGIRCLVTKDGMFTRGGKPIVSAPHIFEALEPVFAISPDYVFDGELYTHALADNFEKIVSLAKKSKPTDEDLAESAEHLQYWIYDLVHPDSWSFVLRNDRLKKMFADYADTWASLVYVPTVKLKSESHLNELYAGYLLDGMEGQMIRKGDSLYEGKRSKNLLKRKEFQDAEFEIVEITEGKGNWRGYAKSITYKLPSGGTFDSGIRGNQAFTKELLARAGELVGKEATVRYQNLSQDGVPRFPVTTIIHETTRW